MDFAEDAVLNLSLILADDVEAEFDHSAIGILVLNPCDLIADRGDDPELFFQFAAQRVARLLTLFDLSAGELPLERHGLVSRALANQELAILFDEGCDDALHRPGVAEACRALATGSTQLVKVKAKAAMPVEQ